MIALCYYSIIKHKNMFLFSLYIFVGWQGQQDSFYTLRGHKIIISEIEFLWFSGVVILHGMGFYYTPKCL